MYRKSTPACDTQNCAGGRGIMVSENPHCGAQCAPMKSGVEASTSTPEIQTDAKN
jgi:hypothetical protein